jgi:hypothetical protein
MELDRDSGISFNQANLKMAFDHERNAYAHIGDEHLPSGCVFKTMNHPMTIKTIGNADNSSDLFVMLNDIVEAERPERVV